MTSLRKLLKMHKKKYLFSKKFVLGFHSRKTNVFAKAVKKIKILKLFVANDVTITNSITKIFGKNHIPSCKKRILYGSEVHFSTE